MINQTILHYKIIEKLGEGGMGVVYKAQDTKLKRDVAIKFLPRQIAASDEERERFKIEAQAAAALNHPNIATIYAIEEQDDEMFIVMEYIEGRELRHLLKSPLQGGAALAAGGVLPVETVLDYASQIASGLQAAHEKGVTHRDIKSSNIMITRKGQVKIMDFGLAKVRGGTQVTKIGTTLGTAAYMSPEQARGEEADARSDIWSFGVVLYEILTGKLPFPGDYEQAVIYSILNEAPEPISELRGNAPSELATLVHKALAKDPSERFQRVDDLLSDLKTLTGFQTLSESRTSGASANSRRPLLWPSVAIGAILLFVTGYFFLVRKQTAPTERLPIAVVDFVNQTKEPELDGLSGMLITALEQSRRLDVMSRARMYDEYKQIGRADLHFVDEATGREIAKRANVSALAVATIRKFGQLYTVDFKVINPQSGDRIFSTKVEGSGQESIPGLLDQLSDKTRLDLKEPENVVLLDRPGVADITTANLGAYQHYFKGQEFIDKLDFEQAKEEFRKAIEIDSTFALAYYRLSYAMGWNSEQLAQEPLEKALRFIDRIPEKERFRVRAEKARVDQGFAAAVLILKKMEKLYPQDKEMLFNIADYAFHGGDYATAVTYFDKVLAIAPNHERTQFHYGQAVTSRYTDPASNNNDFRAALAWAIRDRQKRPDVPELTVAVATLHAYLGEYQKAEAEIMAYLSQATTLQAKQQARRWLAGLLPYTGEYKRALSSLDTAIEEAFTGADTAGAIMGLIYQGFMSGAGQKNNERASGILDRVLVFKERTDVPALKSGLALFAAQCNRQAVSVELLEQAPNPFATAVTLSTVGQCDQAAPIVEAIKNMENVPAFLQYFCFYHFAECRFEEGDFASAQPYAEAALQLYHPLDFFTRGVYYPKTLFLLGKINEAKGDAAAARQYYERLLDLWKNADDDLPDLLEAKRRLAALTKSRA